MRAPQRAAQTADVLIEDVRQGAAVGHDRLDALRYDRGGKLVEHVLTGLTPEPSLGRAGAGHAAIDLVAGAVAQHGPAWAFLGASQQTADRREAQHRQRVERHHSSSLVVGHDGLQNRIAARDLLHHADHGRGHRCSRHSAKVGCPCCGPGTSAGAWSE